MKEYLYDHWLGKKRVSAISQWQTFIRVLPTRWRRKPNGIEITSLSSYVYIGWQYRNFLSFPCQLVFAAILWVKLSKMFATVVSLGWQVNEQTDIFINQRIGFYLKNTINLRPLSPHIAPCCRPTHEMAVVS